MRVCRYVKEVRAGLQQRWMTCLKKYNEGSVLEFTGCLEIVRPNRSYTSTVQLLVDVVML